MFTEMNLIFLFYTSFDCTTLFKYTLNLMSYEDSTPTSTSIITQIVVHVFYYCVQRVKSISGDYEWTCVTFLFYPFRRNFDYIKMS